MQIQIEISRNEIIATFVVIFFLGITIVLTILDYFYIWNLPKIILLSPIWIPLCILAIILITSKFINELL